jgi:hypothetical protein
VQLRNQLTRGIYVGGILTTILGFDVALGATDGMRRAGFIVAIAAWLWLSIPFGELRGSARRTAR